MTFLTWLFRFGNRCAAAANSLTQGGTDFENCGAARTNIAERFSGIQFICGYAPNFAFGISTQALARKLGTIWPVRVCRHRIGVVVAGACCFGRVK